MTMPGLYPGIRADPTAPACHAGRAQPAGKKPATPYAVTGVYCYDSTVFDVIPTLEPSARGELEITDVNNYYVWPGFLISSPRRGPW
jgi:glucose-1-phosphate thymidylyltransferase